MALEIRCRHHPDEVLDFIIDDGGCIMVEGYTECFNEAFADGMEAEQEQEAT